MYGSSQLLITVTPEQFEKIIDDRLEQAFKKHAQTTPNLATSIQIAPLPELATAKQVCDCLHITRTTLERWSKDVPERAAILIPQRIGKRLVYRREDVMDALKERRRFKADKE